MAYFIGKITLVIAIGCAGYGLYKLWAKNPPKNDSKETNKEWDDF